MIPFQGAGTLYTITSQLVKGGDIGKTLDMKVEFQTFLHFQNLCQGREAAVQLVENMNEGFQKMPISDPNKLKTFIEGTTGRQLRSL